MKELAVLKWHKVGCYATAFAAVENRDGEDGGNEEGNEGNGDGDDDGLRALKEQSSMTSTVQQRRDQKAQGAHWLVTGAKDGKVSLWDIY